MQLILSVWRKTYLALWIPTKSVIRKGPTSTHYPLRMSLPSLKRTRPSPVFRWLFSLGQCSRRKVICEFISSYCTYKCRQRPSWQWGSPTAAQARGDASPNFSLEGCCLVLVSSCRHNRQRSQKSCFSSAPPQSHCRLEKWRSNHFAVAEGICLKRSSRCRQKTLARDWGERGTQGGSWGRALCRWRRASVFARWCWVELGWWGVGGVVLNQNWR